MSGPHEVVFAARGPRAPQQVRESLKYALHTVKLDDLTVQLTPEMRAAIQLYLDSHAVPYLEGALAWAEGEEVVLDDQYVWRPEDVGEVSP